MPTFPLFKKKLTVEVLGTLLIESFLTLNENDNVPNDLAEICDVDKKSVEFEVIALRAFCFYHAIEMTLRDPLVRQAVSSTFTRELGRAAARGLVPNEPDGMLSRFQSYAEIVSGQSNSDKIFDAIGPEFSKYVCRSALFTVSSIGSLMFGRTTGVVSKMIATYRIVT